MGKNDQATPRASDLIEAIGLLTHLPVTASGERGAAAAWAWSIAGAILGLLAALIGSVALFIGLSASVAAGISLCTLVVLSGAMHEDGLADCADGFWGGSSRDRRLEIMKDSRIGAYGVIALCLSLGMRWLLLASLFDAGLVFGPLVATAALSRAGMPALMRFLPQARDNGLSASVGRTGQDTVVMSAVTAIAIALVFSGFAALPAVLVSAASTLTVAKIALAKIGGQTGDVLGAGQQVAEIGMLMTFAAVAL